MLFWLVLCSRGETMINEDKLSQTDPDEIRNAAAREGLGSVDDTEEDEDLVLIDLSPDNNQDTQSL